MNDIINSIIQGDCLELFSTIPDNSVDMAFADPPFNLNKKYNNYKDRKDFQDYLNWCQAWISEMVRVTKPSGSIFLHNIPKWLTYYVSYLNKYAFFKHWISWDAPSSPMGKSLQPAHYGILFYGKSNKDTKINELRYPHRRDRKQGYLIKDYGGKKDKLHPFGPLVSDVWTDIHRIKHNKSRDTHPCQLPVHLLDRLILLSTDEADTVLDPFVGTGTTAISAKRLGRNFIGFDIDPQYVEIAKDKILNTETNYKLGNVWVSFYLREVITIRNRDWNGLEKYFIIPESLRTIDFKKIKLKNTKLIPPDQFYKISTSEQQNINDQEKEALCVE